MTGRCGTVPCGAVPCGAVAKLMVTVRWRRSSPCLCRANAAMHRSGLAYVGQADATWAGRFRHHRPWWV